MCQDFEISPDHIYSLDAKRLLARFPNLAMILALGSPCDPIPSACRIYLLKPLRTSTVLGIIVRTPVYHPIGQQGSYSRRERMPSDKLLSRSSTYRRIRAAERIRQLSITETGWLLSDDPGSESSWSTPLKFEGTCVRNFIEDDDDEGHDQHNQTIFEILKVAGRQRNDLFGYLSSREPPSDLEKSTRFNVAMEFSVGGFDAFIERVSFGLHVRENVLTRCSSFPACTSCAVSPGSLAKPDQNSIPLCGGTRIPGTILFHSSRHIPETRFIDKWDCTRLRSSVRSC